MDLSKFPPKLFPTEYKYLEEEQKALNELNYNNRSHCHHDRERLPPKYTYGDGNNLPIYAHVPSDVYFELITSATILTPSLTAASLSICSNSSRESLTV